MVYNQNVNFTPDTPATCKPTSGVTCTYCKSKSRCDNQLPRDDIFGFNAKTDNVKIVCKDAVEEEPAHLTDFT